MMSNVNESQSQVNPRAEAVTPPYGAVIVFDGECNFCNAWVDFVIARDPSGYFKFAASQAHAARPLLEQYEIEEESFDTVFLIEESVLYRRSDAALRIVRRLKWPWPILCAFTIVPRVIRDGVYNLIARNRYRWFGKRRECRVPTVELENRFLR